MKFTEEIKIAMIRKGVTHMELAKRIGSSSQNLTNKMKRDDWKLSDLELIANALGLELKVYMKEQ